MRLNEDPFVFPLGQGCVGCFTMSRIGQELEIHASVLRELFGNLENIFGENNSYFDKFYNYLQFVLCVGNIFSPSVFKRIPGCIGF